MTENKGRQNDPIQKQNNYSDKDALQKSAKELQRCKATQRHKTTAKRCKKKNTQFEAETQQRII